MTNSAKTSEQVLVEARAWLADSRDSQAADLTMGLTGAILVAAGLFGLALLLGQNALYFGRLLVLDRLPWQPALAFAVWFAAAYVSAHSDSRRWQNYSFVVMVASAAGMVVFALRAVMTGL
jgi:hypothetical protein